MDQRDVLLRLTDSLLAAPGSHDGWQAFLLELCDVLEGSAASFISHDLASNTAAVTATARTDPEAVSVYHQRWYRDDPWAHNPKANRLRSGTVVLGDELISHEQMRRTAYYNDFGRHYGIVHCIAGMIEVEPHAFSCLSINGEASRQAFGDAERALMSALMRPLQRALDLHRRLAGAELLAANVTTVVDRLPHGVLLLSAAGRVQFVNRAAEEILQARDGLTLDRGELHAATAADTARLRGAIRRATVRASGELVCEEAALTLARPSGKRPLSLLAAALPRYRVVMGTEPSAIAVFVTDPDRQPPAAASILREMFGLTPAEAELVTTLVSGASVQEAADRLRLAHDTVRKRLKAVFQKTDTHRQADLMRLVLLTTLPRGS